MPYYILIAIIYILSGWLSYIFFKPYLKRYPSKTIYNWVLILGILLLGLGFLGNYIMTGPDYFEAGIEQLHKNKYVNDKVGDFQSYTYKEDDFNELKNQAIFDVELKGNGQVLFVTCIMKKNKENWFLSKIQVQKLVSQKE